jgi:histidyl-tRNA synthetase
VGNNFNTPINALFLCGYCGEQEMATNSFSLKNLATGDQMLVNFEGLKEALLSCKKKKALFN